ncbi:putative DD34D transposase [Trichonephila clavipes]|nr:putative DD34D transposase [Trichonephila clavipes]
MEPNSLSRGEVRTDCGYSHCASRGGAQIPLLSSEAKANFRYQQGAHGCSSENITQSVTSVVFKKKLHVWVPYQLTPKDTMDRISICKALSKQNEIDPFSKKMVTGNDKCVAYYNIGRKLSCSKCSEATQTVAKPGLASRKVLLCIWWDWKGIIY